MQVIFAQLQRLNGAGNYEQRLIGAGSHQQRAGI